jgi:aminoglycoside phosphotransferase (APT) family kinase protein
MTRKAAMALPMTPVAHGDFYHRNVLLRPEGTICVVDWEYLGPGPRYGDPVRLWSVLPGKTERDALLSALLASTPAENHADIALLALWYALRRIGENVKAPRTHQNPGDIEHAWAVLPEARELAREYGVHPNA